MKEKSKVPDLPAESAFSLATDNCPTPDSSRFSRHITIMRCHPRGGWASIISSSTILLTTPNVVR